MKKPEFIWGLVLISMVGLSSCIKDDPTGEDNDPTIDAKTEWTKSLALPVNPAIRQNYMPAVDDQDNVYVLMCDFIEGYAIQAFDKNGTELWQKSDPTVTPHHNMPTYFDGQVFFATDKKVISLDAADGSKAWEYLIPDSMLYITSALAVVEDFILITLESGTAEHSYLFALNARSGSVAGTLAVTTDRIWLNLAARGNLVYLVHGSLYQVTVNSNGSMTLNWQVQLPGDDPTYYFSFGRDMVISENGQVTFAYAEQANPSLDIIVSYNSQGELLWSYERPFASRLTLDDQGNIYEGGVKDLIKIDGSTGQKVWSATPPSEYDLISMGSFTSMVHAADGNTYCGDIYGIYGTNGEGKNKYEVYPSTLEISDVPFTDVTLLSNGNIIVLTMGGEVEHGWIHCIKANTGGISSKGWPKRGGDAANTFNGDL